MEDFINELIADLTAELTETDNNFNEVALKSKVNNAVRDVIMARHYPDYYSEEKKVLDLNRYYSTIRRIALYDYNSIGVENVEQYSVNETTYTPVERNKLFSGINALC